MHAELHYLFRHAVMREVAYHLQLPSARAGLHALAFHVIEDAFDEAELAPLAEELADHAALGLSSEPALAAREAAWLQVAADHARGAFENARAHELLLRLASHPQARDGKRARLEAARLSLLMGRAEECESLLPDADTDAGLAVECLITRCEARTHVADYPGAQALAQAAYDQAEAAGLAGPALDARLALVGVIQRQGDPGRARELCEQLVQQTEGQRLAKAKSLLAWALMLQGDLQGAQAMYEECNRLHQSEGNTRGAHTTRGNLGHVLRRMGRAEEGLACYLEASAEARRTGDQRSYLTGLGNIGNAYRQLKRYDDALECLQRAVALARELGDPHLVALNTGARGGVLFELRRYEEAYECCLRAEEVHRTLGSMQGLMTNLGNRGTVAAAMGRHSDAIDALTEAMSLMRTLKVTNPVIELGLREALVRSLNALQRDREAQDAANAALEWLAQNNVAGSEDGDVAKWIETLKQAAKWAS